MKLRDLLLTALALGLPALGVEAPAPQATCYTTPDGREQVNILCDGACAASAVEGGWARPCALPDNRVTRALREVVAAHARGGRPDVEWLEGEDCLSPGDETSAAQLMDAWCRQRQENPWWAGWFCDASGDNLVFFRTLATGALTFELNSYRWEAARGAYIHRGRSRFISRLLFFDPAMVEFDARGMRLHIHDRSEDGANELHLSHHFDYDAPHRECRFLCGDREIIDLFLAEWEEGHAATPEESEPQP